MTGANNTGIGFDALAENTGGHENTATGVFALSLNTTGHHNTATGVSALERNTGNYNTATGSNALAVNTTGAANTAMGLNALLNNNIGSSNTGIGINALANNLTGASNTAVGVNALVSSRGSNNVGLGANTGQNLSNGSNNVYIGSNVVGVAGESNTTRIKNVYGSMASGRAVYVNSDLKIGTLASTRRVKENIKPMDKASEAILALKPVSFRYKKEIDASGTSQFGLVAEDVAETDPELVTRDTQGKPETVRYEAVNAMLLNEFLKEHRTVEEQDCKLREQGATIAELKTQIEALTAGLQKVTAQIELNKPRQQTVKNTD